MMDNEMVVGDKGAVDAHCDGAMDWIDDDVLLEIAVDAVDVDDDCNSDKD